MPGLSPGRLYLFTACAAAVLGALCVLGALDLIELQRAAALGAQIQMRKAWVDFALLALVGSGLAAALARMVLGERSRACRAERLEHNHARMRDLVFDSVAEGIVVADLASSQLLLNPAARRMLGGEPAPSGDWKVIPGLFYPDGKKPVAPADMPLARAARGERVEASDYCFKLPGQETCLYLRVTGRPLRDSEGGLTGGVVVFRDVTGNRRADERIRKLSQDLGEQTTKLSAASAEIEDFAHSVSHGLRAPLRAVDGFSKLLEEHLSRAPSEDRRLLSVIQLNTRRMGAVLDDLLAYLHLGQKEIECSRVDIEALGRAVFAEAKARHPACEARLTVRPMPAAWADAAMIGQVLANLLDNALKFSEPRKEAAIEVGAGETDGQTVYYVRDNGVGFNMRYVHRLFGMFQRLHGPDEFEGTGVGLAIVARIVQRHGGRVWAESQEGRGATFYFTLPTARVS